MAIQEQLHFQNFGTSQDCGLDNWWCLIPQSQQQQLIQFDNPNLDNQSCISSHFQKHMLELEQFANLQSERLRLAMQEKQRQQTSQLLQRYQSWAQLLLNHKEQQISKAIGRTAELEDQLRRMEADCQAWQRMARENESTVASLNTTIQRLRESAAADNGTEDAESCCQNREEEEEKLGQQSSSRPCRSCNRRTSCVVMLPCRHLCCCRDCGAFLDSCPVCTTAKKAVIEALI